MGKSKRPTLLDKGAVEMEAYRKGYKKEAVKPQEENMLMMFTHMTKVRKYDRIQQIQ